MRKLIFLMCIFCSAGLFAQQENAAIQKGNDLYKADNFSGAETNYESAIKLNPESEPANYNLGNAFFGQQNFDTAIVQYEKVAENTTDPSVRAQAFHNLGNAQLMKKEYEKSIEAYKKSLRSNPNDMDTKYNLAYAQKKLEQQQQQKKNQDKQDQQAQQQPKKYSPEDMERIMQALNNEDKQTQDKLNKQKMTPQKITIDKDW